MIRQAREGAQRKPTPDSPMLGLPTLIRLWISSMVGQAPSAELDSTTTSSWSIG
jgi:hypothetical protein